MVEITAKELMAKPVEGYYWKRYDDQATYHDGVVKIYFSGAHWMCNFYGHLKNTPEGIIFYGPLVKPGIPKGQR